MAHAAYFAEPGGRAEVAWVVADDQRGRGLGTLLLAHLAERAEEVGIGPFVAYVLPTNKEMIEVLRESGVPLTTPLQLRSYDGVWASGLALHVRWESELCPLISLAFRWPPHSKERLCGPSVSFYSRRHCR